MPKKTTERESAEASLAAISKEMAQRRRASSLLGEEVSNSVPQARHAHHEVLPDLTTKSVASILETDLDATMEYWMELVKNDKELTCVPLSVQDRTGHLPQLFHDLICRLRLPKATEATFSVAACKHGQLRCRQGYTPPMLVDESRILEVSIFQTLQNNSRNVDFSKVLRDIMTIADEVDSQLQQAMVSLTDPSTRSAA